MTVADVGFLDNSFFVRHALYSRPCFQKKCLSPIMDCIIKSTLCKSTAPVFFMNVVTDFRKKLSVNILDFDSALSSHSFSLHQIVQDSAAWFQDRLQFRKGHQNHSSCNFLKSAFLLQSYFCPQLSYTSYCKLNGFIRFLEGNSNS